MKPYSDMLDLQRVVYPKRKLLLKLVVDISLRFDSIHFHQDRPLWFKNIPEAVHFHSNWLSSLGHSGRPVWVQKTVQFSPLRPTTFGLQDSPLWVFLDRLVWTVDLERPLSHLRTATSTPSIWPLQTWPSPVIWILKNDLFDKDYIEMHICVKLNVYYFKQFW